MMKINKTQALQLLERAVQEKGADHKAACVYFVDGVPQCIIGHVLAELGIRWSNDGDDDGFGSSLPFIRHALENDYNLTLTDGAFEVLARAQREQDALGTWGQALEVARARASVLV